MLQHRGLAVCQVVQKSPAGPGHLGNRRSRTSGHLKQAKKIPNAYPSALSESMKVLIAGSGARKNTGSKCGHLSQQKHVLDCALGIQHPMVSDNKAVGYPLSDI